MSGETTVGSIIAYLRMDRGDWTRGKDATTREAAQLDGKKIRITVTTNAADAAAAIKAASMQGDAANGKALRSNAALAAAQRSLANSSNSVATAQQRVAAAQERIRATGAGTAQDYQRLRAAEQGLAAAMRNHETAADRVALAQHRVNTALDTTIQKADGAKRNVGLLSTAIIGLAPAAVPLAAVGVAGLAGFIGVAGTAVLAIKGVQRELVVGTGATKQYSGALSIVKSDLTNLEAVAGRGVLSSFTATVKSLHGQMPFLTRDVAMFSTGLGIVVGNIAPGMLSFLHQLNPLFVTFDQQLISGSARFKQWAASSTAVQHFVAYAQQSLPTAEQFLGQLATTLGHVAQAAAPFGSTTLQTITMLSRAINALPIGTLQVIVPLLAGLKIGMSANSAASNSATALGTWATRAKEAGGAASGAAGLVGTLGKAVGFLGPVGIAAGIGLAGLSMIEARHQQVTVATTERVNALTQAIEEQRTSVGILAELQANGATAAADKLGVSQQTLVNSVLKGGTALDQVKSKIAATNAEYLRIANYLQSNQAALDQTRNPQYYQQQLAQYHALGTAMGTLSAKLQETQADYAKAQQAAAAYARSQGDAVLAAQVEAGTVDKVALGFHLSADAYYAAKLAADKKTASDKAQTAAMQMESDAAGILTAKLDILNGKNLSVAQAQTASASATNQLVDSLKQNGRAIDGTTAATISNQQAVQGKIQADQAAAEAIGKATGSSKSAARAYLASRDSLLAQLQAQHLLTPALQAYIDRLYDLKDLKVPPTKVDLDKAAADAKLAAYRRAIGQLPKNISTSMVVLGADHAKQVIRSVVDYANSQSAVIHVTTINTSTGAVSGGRQVANAAGGGVPDGWSTVGEQGWEAVHKQGNTVQVYSHAQSKKLLPQGPSVPAWASGTPGAKTSRKVKGKAKPKQVIVPITVTAGNGQAYGVASFIKGQIPSVRAATKLLAAATNDAFQLQGIRTKLAAVKADYANLRQDALNLRDAATGSLRAGVDASAYGDIGDLTNAYRSKKADAGSFLAEIRKLQSEHLNTGLLTDLASKGKTAGLDALAAASPAQIAALNKAYAGFTTSTGQAGSLAARSIYGKQLADDTREIRTLTSQSARTEAAMTRAVLALAQLLHRPVKVSVGGKEFAHAVVDSGVIQGVYDDLERALLYGRKH